MGEVGRDGGQVVGVDRAAFGGDGVGGAGDVAGGGDAIGEQLVELDDLLVPVGVDGITVPVEFVLQWDDEMGSRGSTPSPVRSSAAATLGPSATGVSVAIWWPAP